MIRTGCNNFKCFPQPVANCAELLWMTLSIPPPFSLPRFGCSFFHVPCTVIAHVIPCLCHVHRTYVVRSTSTAAATTTSSSAAALSVITSAITCRYTITAAATAGKAQVQARSGASRHRHGRSSSRHQPSAGAQSPRALDGQCHTGSRTRLQTIVFCCSTACPFACLTAHVLTLTVGSRISVHVCVCVHADE
jgi:hypothetical protein